MRPALLLLLLLGEVAHADTRGSLVPSLRLGAGYDSNLFLDANPSGAITSQIRSDAIFDVEPHLDASLASAGHALWLSADYLERLTLSNGDLRDLLLRAGWLTPGLGPLHAIVEGVYEHYAASQFPGDTFDLGGGEAGLRLHPRRWAQLDVRYRADARVYSDPSRNGQIDTEQRASLSTLFRPLTMLDLSLAYAYLHVDSTEQTARLDRHRGSVELVLRPFGWLSASAGYAFAWQHLPEGMLATTATTPLAGSRDDSIHDVTVSLSARPLRWLELFARYDLLLSTSSDPAGAWRRDQLLGGVVLAFDVSHTWTHPPPEAPSLDGAQVTFRFRGHANAVSVVGDWNEWNPAASPLAARGDAWQATYTLPPGRHQYAFSVDGAVVPPVDAPAYQPDGFGGKNGVVEVHP